MDHRSARRALAPLLAAALAALAVPPPVAARAEALFGTPPITRFAVDLQVYPQNFAIAQDATGMVYLGNSDGVLAFDGARWELTPLPNKDLVRSLAFDGDRRVYVGGYGQLGWLEQGPTGAPAFHDLTPRALELTGGKSFADVWELFVFPEGVLFRALNHAFLYEPATDRLRAWQHAGRFGTAWRDADGIVLQFRGEGFKRLVGDGWQPVPGGEAFKDLAYHAYPMPDGGRLIASRDMPWSVLRDGAVVAAAVPPGWPNPQRLAGSLTLADGTLVVSGDDGMVHLWDPREARAHRMRVADERLDAAVVAHDGGILIASDSAFYRMEWPATWTAVGAEVGLRGSLRGAITWRGERHVLTGSDAVTLQRDAEGEVRIRRNGWTEQEAWDLLPIDAQHALFAESYALYQVGAGAPRRLSDLTLYPRLLVRSRFDPGLVLVGTEHGLALYARGPAGWAEVARQEDLESPNVMAIVERADGELWLGTERGGLIRMTLDAARRAVTGITRYGTAQGLALDHSGAATVAALPDGRIIASTPVGVFRLEGERFVAEPLEGLTARRGEGDWLWLAVAPDGTTWAWTRYALWARGVDGDWQPQDVGTVARGVIESLRFDADGRPVVITTSSVLMRFASGPPTAGEPPALALRRVVLAEEGGAAHELALVADPPARIAQGEHVLRFRFGLPELRQQGAARYRGRLDPLEPQMSDWGSGAQYAYYRLRAGRYRMLIEARDADGRVSAAPPFEFEVVPPWWAGPLARATWLLLALGALGWATRQFVRRRTARLASDKARLEGMVEARTRELADANRKLDTIAHLDGLTGIPNRRRLDEYLEQVWALCGERERPLALLAIDVDRFKDYNDKHGHLAGDTLLKRLAPILTRNLRRTEDLAARYGGEEFLVVLPGADAEVAREVAEALREKVAGSSIGATVSIGVAAETPRAGRSVTELVALADAALYRAKDAGRDRVVVSGA